jgi:hypothetical protein
LADLAAEGTEWMRWSRLPASTSRPRREAAGWTIAHQVGHLTWTDELTVVACRDPEGFLAARSTIRR